MLKNEKFNQMDGLKKN